MSEIDYKADTKSLLINIEHELESGGTDSVSVGTTAMSPIGTWRELIKFARLGAAVEAMLDAHSPAIQNDDTGESGRALFDDLYSAAHTATV